MHSKTAVRMFRRGYQARGELYEEIDCEGGFREEGE